MAMSIIPHTWLEKSNDGEVYCFWPKNLKNYKELTKSVINKSVPDKKNSRKCLINIKFKTNSYDKAKDKLKKLEEETVSSCLSSSEEDIRIKRKSKPNRRYQNFSSESEEPVIPMVPKVKTPKAQLTLTSASDPPDIRLSSTKTPAPHSLFTRPHSRESINQTSTAHSEEQDDIDVTLVGDAITLQELNLKLTKIESLARQTFTKVGMLAQDLKNLALSVMLAQGNNKEKDKAESELTTNMPITLVEELKKLNNELNDDKKFADLESLERTALLQKAVARK